MREQFVKSLKSLVLSDNDKNITVALSGGADSVALLYLLLSVRDELGLSVSACHLNHCLRGEESLRDQHFVEDLCKELDVALSVKAVDINALKQKNGGSTETVARNVRYEFFGEVSLNGTVATAHNADDNAETVLLHIARGSGINGLCGIPQRRGNIIRPLLCFSSKQIRDFCKENGYAFVEDSTNNTDDYSRNFVRHNVVPPLNKLNPDFVSAIKRMCENLTYEKELLYSLYIDEYNKRVSDKGLDIKGIGSLPPALKKGIVRLFIENSGFTADNNITDIALSALENGKKGFSFYDRSYVSIKNGFMFFPLNEEKPAFSLVQTKKSAEFIKNQGKINNLLLKNAIDCDKIIGTLHQRTRLSGDSITLAHRGVTKTLKKLFSEEGINNAERDLYPVLADSKGVVWVYGFGVDARVLVSDTTTDIIFVDCERK